MSKKSSRKKIVDSSLLSTEIVTIPKETETHSTSLLVLWMLVKATILALGFVLVTLVITGAIFAYSYLYRVSSHAGIGVRPLISIVRSGWSTPVPQTHGRENILLLGIDTLGNRDSTTINTDTIMIASLDLDQGKITTFSIPRDLYIRSENAKVNSLYSKARASNNPTPEKKTQQSIEQLTGLTIHRTVVLEMTVVGKLIDALGGIDVDVERSFTDEKFPREDVDVTKEKDPQVLYKTISFTKGIEHMDAVRALEYMRSRHSKDPLEGSDDARALRQQRVIQALLRRLEDGNTFKNPAYVGDLLKLYTQDFARYIPLEEMVALGKVFLKSKQLPTFESKHIPIQDVEPNPVLYHPERLLNGQWVYLPIDPTGTQLQSLIQEWLP